MSLQVDEVFRGREYHFSWCREPDVTFTYQDAQQYCERLPREGHPVGFRAVSIEDQDEDCFISSTIRQCECLVHNAVLIKGKNNLALI